MGCVWSVYGVRMGGVCCGRREEEGVGAGGLGRMEGVKDEEGGRRGRRMRREEGGGRGEDVKEDGCGGWRRGREEGGGVMMRRNELSHE